MPHDDLSKRGFGGTGDSPGMGGKNPYSGTLTDCPITGHARPATAGRADPGPISGPNCSCTSNRIAGPSERPVPIRARSGHPREAARVTGPGGMKTAPHIAVGRRLRRLTSYQASPRLVVTGSATLVGNPDDVPPAAYSGEWVPGSARGAPTGGGRGFSSTPSLARRGSLTQ